MGMKRFSTFPKLQDLSLTIWCCLMSYPGHFYNLWYPFSYRLFTGSNIKQKRSSKFTWISTEFIIFIKTWLKVFLSFHSHLFNWWLHCKLCFLSRKNILKLWMHWITEVFSSLFEIKSKMKSLVINFSDKKKKKNLYARFKRDDYISNILPMTLKVMPTYA